MKGTRISTVLRQSAIRVLLSISGSHAYRHYREIRACERADEAKLVARRSLLLEALVRHCWQHVPYYRSILEGAGVVRNGAVDLARFTDIPLLTRQTLRERYDDLEARDRGHRARRPFVSMSGGSSGEPVQFLHDRTVQDWLVAGKFYFCHVAGKEIGQRELRIWGSERDLLDAREKPSIRLRNWLYNRRELNAFRMGGDDMRRFVEIINRVGPVLIEGYADSVFELASFARQRGLSIASVRAVITSAGTLHEPMRAAISDVFKSPVFNRYGTREVGDIACSCERQDGLHALPMVHHVEVLDSEGRPCPPGVAGRVVVTHLRNYSMPLLRYDIGDTAALAPGGCACGRTLPLLTAVEGRRTSLFRAKNGAAVPAEFFIHFIGVVYNAGGVSRVQIVQEEFERIRIKAVVQDQSKYEACQPLITDAIRRAMGAECRVEFEEVIDIPRLASGKYLYTVSHVSAAGGA